MKKKIKTMLTVTISLLFLCSFPAFAVTREEALTYAKSKLDTKVGNGQCVAYAKDYYKTVFGESVRGNGSDYINNVPDGFTQYLYGSSDWDPQPGDIVSWSWNKYGEHYGHVGIITRVDEKGFYYLNQNPYPVKESRFTYGQSGWTLAGVVRPPFEETVLEETEAITESAPKDAPASLADSILQVTKNMADAVKDAVQAPDLESGSFAIISAASGKRINLSVNSVEQVKNGTAVNLYKEVGGTENDTQQFVFKKSKDNTYLIQPNNSNYTVNISSRKAGAKLICWASAKKNNEEWIVESSGTGYTFRLKNKPELYLTQTGTSLTIQKKSGRDNQIFHIK